LAALSLAVIIAAAPFAGSEDGPVSTATRITEATLLFGAIVAACIALRGVPALSFLRSRPARITADLSFCLYLVHVPLVELFAYVSHALVPNISTWSPVILAPVRATVVLIAAFGIATLSRRYLELPAMRMRAAFLPAETRIAAPATRANQG
jgi:peptidoglycan/LPS O-acetylase OafA/YrhL